jgi:hypothetical protein
VPRADDFGQRLPPGGAGRDQRRLESDCGHRGGAAQRFLNPLPLGPREPRLLAARRLGRSETLHRRAVHSADRSIEQHVAQPARERDRGEAYAQHCRGPQRRQRMAKSGTDGQPHVALNERAGTKGSAAGIPNPCDQ